MLIRRSLSLHSSALRPSTRLCKTCAERAPIWAQLQARHFHPSVRIGERRVTRLDNQEQIVAEGIPGLFSPAGIDLGWTQYQSKILQELDEQTVGSALERSKPFDLLIETAREPVLAPTFNRASMAWNNEFFYEGILTNEPTPADQLGTELRRQFETAFASIDNLQSTFIKSALAMFGPGFTWLVQAKDIDSRASQFRILNTYLAGSPHPGAHWRQQGTDMTTQSVDSNNGITARLGEYAGTAGSFGKNSGYAKPKFAPGGVDLTPVLCVNTWEHVYLPDWGYDKEGYLNAWWERINWSKVRSRCAFTNQHLTYKTQFSDMLPNDRRPTERRY